MFFPLIWRNSCPYPRYSLMKCRLPLQSFDKMSFSSLSFDEIRFPCHCLMNSRFFKILFDEIGIFPVDLWQKSVLFIYLFLFLILQWSLLFFVIFDKLYSFLQSFEKTHFFCKTFNEIWIFLRFLQKNAIKNAIFWLNNKTYIYSTIPLTKHFFFSRSFN